KVQSVPSEDHPAERQPRPINLLIYLRKISERQRSLIENRHLLLTQELVEFLRRSSHGLRHDDQTAPVGEGSPYLPHREIKCIGVKECPHVLLVELEERLCGLEQPRNVSVADFTAFRLTGRSGGVNQIGQVLSTNFDFQVLPALFPAPFRDLLQF